MKKTELVEGEVYALGAASTSRAIPGRLERLEGEVKADKGRLLRGIIFRQVVEAGGRLTNTYMPYGWFVDDLVILDSARGVLELWEPYAARRDAAAARERAEREHHGHRLELLDAAVTRLRSAFGLDKQQVQGTRRGFPGASIAFDAEVIEELTRRFEPMGVAGSAIEAFVEELRELALLRDEPELPTLIDIARGGALAKVREGLAMTDAELEASAHA